LLDEHNASSGRLIDGKSGVLGTALMFFAALRDQIAVLQLNACRVGHGVSQVPSCELSERIHR
jgi:hypothetical protein